MRIDRSTLGITGEYAAAAQLCRQGIYAQLTLGNLKRADLLVLSGKERMARIEVKSKQTREWPNCKGIYGENVFLILVDFESKDLNDQPDFYILSVSDWVQHVKQVIKKYKEKHPDRRCEMDGHNCPVYHDEVNKRGDPYRGCGIRPEHVTSHRNAWWKIAADLGVQQT